MRIRLFPLQDNPFVRSRLFFLTEIKNDRMVGGLDNFSIFAG